MFESYQHFCTYPGIEMVKICISQSQWRVIPQYLPSDQLMDNVYPSDSIVFMRCCAFSLPTHLPPKLSTTSKNCTGRVTCLHNPGVPYARPHVAAFHAVAC